MKKFLERIQSELNTLNEAGEDGMPPEPGEGLAGEEQPPVPETPESALPEEMDGDDDIVKVKIDYAECCRKALIMAPKHIDDVDYAKLTKVVDVDNFEEMNELVLRIVRNNYPHPDFEV